jgi:hypothetical protein
LIPSRSFNEALSRAKLHPLHILSRYSSLSLFYLNQPPTAIGRFPAYRLSPRLATSALDIYINLDPFVLALPTGYDHPRAILNTVIHFIAEYYCAA